MKKYLRQSILSLILVIFTLFLISGCSKTEYTNSENIIEPSVLKEEMSKDNVIVIDARSKDDYARGHLVGAINLEPSELTVNEPVKATIAPKEKVEKVLSKKGIENDSILYIYDNNAGVNAGRIWWTLKAYGHENVKVINKGQSGIEQEGLPVSAEPVVLPETTYTAKELDTSYIATLDEVKSLSTTDQENCILLDVRSLAEYEEGTIPSAINYPHLKNLYSDGSFKAAQHIYLDYNDLGIGKKDQVILFCKSSYRATQTAFLLKEAGFENVKVYDGAWLEWSSSSMPIQTIQEKAPITQQDAS